MTDKRLAEIEALVPKPQISDSFTNDDIHAIRKWHYEITKDLTREERSAFYNKGVEHYFDYLRENNLPMPKMYPAV